MSRTPLRHGALACLAFLTFMAHAGTLEAGASVSWDARLVSSRFDELAMRLAVPKDTDVDADLGADMARAASDFLARLRPLLESWVAAARARPGATDGEVVRSVDNRIVNELALWRLLSPGAEYDAAMLATLHVPSVCRRIQDEATMVAVLERLRAVPMQQRAAAVDGERRLLQGWGGPHPSVPPRPDVTLETIEAEAIERLAAAEPVAGDPMPPALANAVLANVRKVPVGSVRCALHQWGLGVALARPDAVPATLLVAWRYAKMPRVADILGEPAMSEKSRASSDDYPPMAQMRGVTGDVTVRIPAGESGRPAEVASRAIEVQGVDAHPVAFETLLDEASIGRALKQPRPPSEAASAPKEGRTIIIRWRLE